MRKVACLVGLMALALAGPARAEPDANYFERKLAAGDQVALVVIYGYATAYSWSNVKLEAEGQKPFYCPPDKLALTPEQTSSIFRRHLQAHPKDGTYPGALIMLELAFVYEVVELAFCKTNRYCEN